MHTFDTCDPNGHSNQKVRDTHCLQDCLSREKGLVFGEGWLSPVPRHGHGCGVRQSAHTRFRGCISSTLSVLKSGTVTALHQAPGPDGLRRLCQAICGHALTGWPCQDRLIPPEWTRYLHPECVNKLQCSPRLIRLSGIRFELPLFGDFVVSYWLLAPGKARNTIVSHGHHKTVRQTAATRHKKMAVTVTIYSRDGGSACIHHCCACG